MPRRRTKSVVRRSAPTVDAGRRTGITEVEEVMTPRTGRIRPNDVSPATSTPSTTRSFVYLCNRCADICPEKCLTFVPLEQVEMPPEQLETAVAAYGHATDQPMTVLLKDDTVCIRCGLCAERCPTEAMTMERFNFTESTE